MNFFNKDHFTKKKKTNKKVILKKNLRLLNKNENFYKLNIVKSNILQGNFFFTKKNINPQVVKQEIVNNNLIIKNKLSTSISFKYTYDFFFSIKNLLNRSKDYFSSNLNLNRFDLSNFFNININLFSIKNLKKTKKNKLKSYIRNLTKLLKNHTKLIFYKLILVKKISIKQVFLKKRLLLILHKIFLKRYQRILFILNYGFFFTFLLRSNNIIELNKIFNKTNLFGIYTYIFKFYISKFFRNYLFKNDFIGCLNRFYFNNKEVSSNFSDTFIQLLLSSSKYNNIKNNLFKSNINFFF